MTDEKPASRDANRFIIRFPPGMRSQIAQLARQNNRSMNSEILARLSASMDDVVGRSQILEQRVEFLHRAVRTIFGMIADSSSPDEISQIKERLETIKKGS